MRIFFAALIGIFCFAHIHSHPDSNSKFLPRITTNRLGNQNKQIQNNQSSLFGFNVSKYNFNDGGKTTTVQIINDRILVNNEVVYTSPAGTILQQKNMKIYDGRKPVYDLTTRSLIPETRRLCRKPSLKRKLSAAKPSPSRAKTDQLANKNESTKKDGQIFDFESGKIAEIDFTNGNVKINGVVTYEAVDALKSPKSFTTKILDGVLTLNGVVVFKENPKSNFTMAMAMADSTKFSNAKSLTIKVLSDGHVEITDGNSYKKKL